MKNITSWEKNTLGIGLKKLKILLTLSIRHFSSVNPSDLHYYRNDWELMVSILLSVRSRDVLVNEYLEQGWFSSLISKEKILKTSVLELQKLFKPFGFKSKSETIKTVALLPVPWTIEALSQIKGVGTKVLDVYRNLSLKEETVAIDTHTLQTFKKITGLNPSVAKVREYLNGIEHPFKRHLHIVMVRYNKKRQWCDHPKCIFCERLYHKLF